MEGLSHRPPSPPYSSNGDMNLNMSNDMFSEPYTPPQSIRPAPSEPYYDPYAEHSVYPPPPPPGHVAHMYYASPQPTFVRHVAHRPSPTPSDRRIGTRTGRAFGSPNRPVPTSSPRSKRTKPNKTPKKGGTLLPGPLSEITKDYSAPVRDIEAWVNRSAEQRVAEVEKNKGKIARPMNSFMLYRSAYAERVKQYCKENNHQVVSQVTGQSWPMEPEPIRKMYEEYALIERDNHASAHPGYKFAPNKNGKKRDLADLDSDSDGEWGGAKTEKRTKKMAEHDDRRSMSTTPFDPEHNRYVSQYSGPQSHPQSYQPFHHHASMPFHFEPEGLRATYHHPQTMSYKQNADAIKFDEFDPGLAVYDMNTGLTGMPDAAPNLLTSPGHEFATEMVDPRLAGMGANYAYSNYDLPPDMYAGARSYAYTPYPSQAISVQPNEPAHPGMTTFTDGSHDWQHSINEPGADFDRELQNF